MKTVYFTFGSGSENAGHYYVITAETRQQALDEMYRLFGQNWAFWYTEKEWQQALDEGHFRNLKQLDLENHPKLTAQQSMKLKQLERLYRQLYDLAYADDDFNDLLVESKLFPHSLDELAEMVQQLHERV